MYLGPNIPQNVFIAQINEKNNLTFFSNIKCKHSSLVKIFLRDEKVMDSNVTITNDSMCTLKRFLEIVKLSSELDFEFLE
jgi:hypothetical protein